jgi:triphosphoribosyl-dephospho-CoA synthetase
MAGRFSSGASITQQQKTLMIQLELAREGEVISEETLQAYLRYFEEKPMTAEHLTACLALFDWLPNVLPVVEEGDVDVVV